MGAQNSGILSEHTFWMSPYIKNWSPISLLNVDYKISSKALTNRLKETLPDLISFQQTGYIKNRFIAEGDRVISDILEISNIFNLRRYIVTVDIVKAFDSLNHYFLLACLKKIWVGHDFIRWVKILLESQETCIINAGTKCHTSILKKVRAKVRQFLRIFLFYVLKFYLCLLKLIIKIGAWTFSNLLTYIQLMWMILPFFEK